MKRNRRILAFLLSITLGLSCLVMAQTSTTILPVVSIAPPLFPIGQPSSFCITVTNGNPLSTASIINGDSFTFTFGQASGSDLTIDSPALVNSTSLSAGDFAVVLTATNQLTITYQGATKPFRAGESFAIKLRLTAPATIGSGRIVAQGPAAKGGGRYSDMNPAISAISFVDFATGPKGDKGDKGDPGVQGVKGDKGDKGDPGVQ
ncbi:MAG: hypothetical protein AB1757_02420 [Acidobacteriota bacterium]